MDIMQFIYCYVILVNLDEFWGDNALFLPQHHCKDALSGTDIWYRLNKCELVLCSIEVIRSVHINLSNDGQEGAVSSKNALIKQQYDICSLTKLQKNRVSF